MARAIVMPSLGMYTAEGKLVSWLRPKGARVEADDVVAEVETEKATYELQAGAEGILHPVAEVGTILAVEAIVGYILAEGEAPPETPTQSGSSSSAASPSDQVPGTPTPSREAPPASPIARRLAAQHGVDLKCLQGSGPGGRIVEADVMAAAGGGFAPQPADRTDATWNVRNRIPLAGMRAAIAERLRHSLTTAAALTITREAIAGGLVAARQRLATDLGTEVPYDALFVKLLGVALREHPRLNSVIEDDAILELDDVNVGFAVALPGGLIVPVVRNADTRPLEEIVRQVQQLTKRARAGKLRPSDATDGTASISTLGSHGVDAFTPILNPPQSVILGIGRIIERPVVQERKIVSALTCVLSLTFDHRVVDGAPAAQLLESLGQKLADDRYFGGLTTSSAPQ